MRLQHLFIPIPLAKLVFTLIGRPTLNVHTHPEGTFALIPTELDPHWGGAVSRDGAWLRLEFGNDDMEQELDIFNRGAKTGPLSNAPSVNTTLPSTSASLASSFVSSRINQVKEKKT